LAVHEDNPLEELLASSSRGISHFPSVISKKNYASAIRLRAQAQEQQFVIDKDLEALLNA
jgi:hypothetical protein